MKTNSPHPPLWVKCLRCSGETRHNVLYFVSDDRYELPLYQSHTLARCGGCGTHRYVVESGDCEVRDKYTDEVDKEIICYPPAPEHKVKDWSDGLPQKVRKIYSETVDAMNQRMPLLAGIGLRALIETICKDRKVTGTRLFDLIEGLHAKGVLAKAQAERLHGLRFLGNAAAHAAVAAKSGELRAGLSIAEAMMDTIYVVPALSKEVKTGRKRAPPKKRQAKKSTATSQAPTP